MHRWKVASALGKLNSCTRLATQPGMPPGTTCSPTSKDTTIVSGFIPLSGISPPNRQSAKPLNPMSTKSGEGHTRLPLFALTWTVMHVIDEKSPLAGYDAERLEEGDARLLLSIEARDHAIAPGGRLLWNGSTHPGYSGG